MKNALNKETIGANKDRQISESFMLAALLAVSGGYMDAYTYLVRGKVFANAQTGNIVLLGIKITEGKIVEASKYLIPIIAFAIGIMVAELIHSKYNIVQKVHWRQIVLLIEILALIIAAALPIGTMNTAANTLVSFVSALQMESFRHVNGNAFVSTMCTGNLRSGTECLYRHLFKGNKGMKSRWMQYYGIILFFILGAGIGALAAYKLHGNAIVGCCLLLAAAAWRMGKDNTTSVS